MWRDGKVPVISNVDVNFSPWRTEGEEVDFVKWQDARGIGFVQPFDGLKVGMRRSCKYQIANKDVKPFGTRALLFSACMVGGCYCTGGCVQDGRGVCGCADFCP